MACVRHEFGQDRQADYQVKGMLVSKLFPDDLDNMQVLRSRLTFENLLKHPGVKEVVFACPSFALKDRLLMISGRGELSRGIESIQESSYEDMVDENEVKWDGIKDLGQTVTDQSYDRDLEAENGTKLYRRYCLLPKFIRVAFTPDKDHPRNFDHVLRFQLKAPTLQREDGMFQEVMSDSTYLLCAVVKVDPKDPIGNPAEIRVYDAEGKMIKPILPSNNNQRDAIDRKFKPDSRWTTGDPQFKFILFYRKCTAREDEVHFPIQVSPAEYRSPSPVYHFYLPKPEPPETSTLQRRSLGALPHQDKRTLERDDTSDSNKPLRRSLSRRETSSKFGESDEEDDQDRSSRNYTSSAYRNRDRDSNRDRDRDHGRRDRYGDRGYDNRNQGRQQPREAERGNRYHQGGSRRDPYEIENSQSPHSSGRSRRYDHTARGSRHSTYESQDRRGRVEINPGDDEVRGRTRKIKDETRQPKK
ncbi:hypothetical protein F4824DRAFT_511044 [Ustulina deusta]|nr:hypothetical protein F4824DRAFT_511044 [Ustulina deusta]